MKKFTVSFILLLLGAHFLTIIASAERTKPLLSFPKGTKCELRVDGPTARAIVPVVPDGVNLKSVTFEKHFVNCEARSGGEWFEAITVERQAQGVTEQGDWGAISIIVDTDKLRMGGTCHVQIVAKAAAEPNKTAEAPYTFDIELVLPTARLAQLDPLVWEQVRALPRWLLSWLPSGWALSANGRKVLLMEIGGKSRLTKFTIQQVNLTAANDRASDAEVKFTAPSEIAPFQNAQVTPQLSGIFPLGTNRGVAKITAAELADPVTFSLEVRSRWHRWIIFAVIVAGFFFGYLIRFLFQRQIDLNGAKLKIKDFQDRLNVERSAHPDELYLAKLKEVEDKLRPALLKSKDTDINDALTQAQQKFTEAENDLNTRRTNVSQDIKGTAIVLSTLWSLPKTLANIIKSAQAEINSALDTLSKDNVEGARKAKDKICSTIANSFSDAFSHWRGRLYQLLNQLGSNAVALPESIAQLTRNDIEPLLVTVKAINVLEPTFSSEDLKSILKAVHNVQGSVKSIADNLHLRLRELAQTSTVTLSRLPLQNPDSLVQIGDATSKFEEEFAACVEDPVSRTDPIGNLLRPLDEAWSVALLAQIPNEKQQEMRKVKEMLAKYDYAGAVAAVAESVRAARGAEGPALASVELEVAPIMVPSALAANDRHLPTAPLIVNLPAENLSRSAHPIEIDRVQIQRVLRWSRIGQTFLVAIVTAIFGYFMFQERFMGTPADFAGVFAWALAVDLSVAALLQTASTVRSTSRG
jgi:hypothetical protein